MRHALFAGFVFTWLFAAMVATPRAHAQVTLAQDTLSTESPAAAVCGFCGTEGFGVVFRELPAPARGLLVEDFPLTLRSVEIALAAARLNGSTCMNVDEGGSVLVDVEIWAGVTPPTGAIDAMAPGEPWGGTDEELVFAAVDVPIELSIPASGTTGFNLQLNRFEIMDEMGMPLRISAPFTYLRAYVQLKDSTLPGPSCPFSSDGSPLRDDGRISPERSYILANGMGFVWNEAAGVNGDWAVRLNIIPTIPPATDAGSDPDTGAGPRDGGGSPAEDGSVAIDAVVGADAGGGGGGGCACRAARGGPSATSALALACLGLLLTLRRRRA